MPFRRHTYEVSDAQEGKIQAVIPQAKHAIANCSHTVGHYAAIWRILTAGALCGHDSDSAFCQITVVFVW